MKRALAAAFLAAALTAGCAAHPAPSVSPRPPRPPKPGVSALRADLASCFRTPALRGAVSGVLVRSLKTGETLAAINPGTFLMPASNMKVVTAAAAAERLGWDYTFTTKVVAAGPIEGGVLKGDLVIVGSGDPALGGRPTPEGFALVDRWAEAIRAAGVSAVEGRIVGDDNAFEDEGLGSGWAWDDLAYGYAAPVGGLNFNENTARLTFAPGAARGDPVTVEVRPDGSGLQVDSTVTTADPDGEVDLRIRRLPGSARLGVRGSVPAGKTDVTQAVSVDNPTEFLARALKLALAGRGVTVSGEAIDGDALAAPVDIASASTLVTHVSPPLADIVKVLLKASQNLYADTLLKALGRTASGGPASAAAGKLAVRDVLQAWGIGPDQYVQADGSGLSRYNYLNADVLVAVLTRMYCDERHREAFTAALPVAGVDGTLANRMKGTRAEGNARAKTGSIANTRSLSGFVASASGEPLVFSMIVNNFNAAPSDALDAIDRAVVRLAEFRR